MCAHLIYIPAAYLPQPSALYVFRPSPCPSFLPSPPLPIRSDPNERAHFWLPSPPSPPQPPSTSPTSLLDSLVSSSMYIDQGEILRVRVEADQFCDDEPGPQKFVEGVRAEAKGRVRAPYNVIVSPSFCFLYARLADEDIVLDCGTGTRSRCLVDWGNGGSWRCGCGEGCHG